MGSQVEGCGGEEESNLYTVTASLVHTSTHASHVTHTDTRIQTHTVTVSLIQIPASHR